MPRLFEMISNSFTELSTSGLVLRIALGVCSMFAMVHLFSLWGTRYGDHHTMAKSFFLSLVVHGCFGLGWATVAESFPRRAGGVPQEELVQTPVNFVDNVDEAPLQGTSRLPIFHSGPSAVGSALTRDSHASRFERDDPWNEIEAPAMDKTPEADMAQEMPDFATQPEELPPDLEQAQANPNPSRAAVAASPMTVDQPAAESNPEIRQQNSATRAALTRPNNTIDSSPRSNVKRGDSTRTTPFIEEGATLTIPYDVDHEAIPHPQGAPSEIAIQRPGSPQPTNIVDSSAGTDPDVGNRNTGTSTVRRTDRVMRPRSTDGKDEIASRPSIASNASMNNRPVDDRMLPSRSPSETLEDSPRPTLVRPTTPTMGRAPARALETYQARTSGQRMSAALKNGGSEESERAVETSLKWLASVQEKDGHWSWAEHGGGAVDKDPEGRPRTDGDKAADSGITGLVVLSFLGAGYTHEKGPYTSEVRQALDWLIAQQQSDGYLAAKAGRFARNYCHAIATFALAEAYAMQKDAADYPELRVAVHKALKKICDMQNGDGGWRYSEGGVGDESDMSMFGWQLMAVKSGANAGIPVPEETRNGMIRFLKARGRGNSEGLAGYRKNDQPTAAMTAEALFCRQMFGVKSKVSATQEAVGYLRRRLPRVTEYDEYYWYYGTLAMHNLDDESWKEWNNALRDMLISLQHQDGPMAGSWDPRGKWGGIGGRLYSTALSTMCLEVYYRYQSTSKNRESQ